MGTHTFMPLILVLAFVPGEANYSCPLSEANSIDVVYDKHNTKGDFWYRNGSALASCDFSFISTSKRKCSVCLNDSVGAETVVIVLCNLTSGEEPLFEGKNGDISFNKTNCVILEHIGGTEPNNDRGSKGYVILVVSLFAAFGLIMIMLIMWKCHKSQKSPVDGSNTNPSDPEISPELTDVAEMDLLKKADTSSSGISEDL